MQFFLLISIALVAVSQGFRVPISTRFTGNMKTSSALRMSDEINVEPKAEKKVEPKDETKKNELVPLEKNNIENSAAVTGGILGFVLAGPLAGVIFAAVTNFVVKKEDESGEALRGIGKTVIESYNFLSRLDSKYGVSAKIGETVRTSLENSDSEALSNARDAYSKATDKVSELNKQYDLVGKGKEVIVISSTLSDAAIEKVLDLNAKYDFVGTAKKTASKAVDKVKPTSIE